MGNTSGGEQNDQDHFCICMIDENRNNNFENAKWIFCEGCKSWSHSVCALVSDEEYENVVKNKIKWYCIECQNKKSENDQSHTNILPSQEQIQCPDCDFIAKNTRGLRVHQRKHERIVSFHCSENQIDENEIINSFTCKTCKKNFQSNIEMENHLIGHEKISKKIEQKIRQYL